MGPGFLKAVYQEAMEIELGLRAVPNVPQPELQVRYKGRPLKKKYNPDLVRAVNSNGAEESIRNSETKGNSPYFGFLSA